MASLLKRFLIVVVIFSPVMALTGGDSKPEPEGSGAPPAKAERRMYFQKKNKLLLDDGCVGIQAPRF
ncbi:MAG: hypothetical protein HC902_11040 [Calothrix sp. SM1_5_4]|nr:hypothetical protein [Calothrix sp. SM1_5_4]